MKDKIIPPETEPKEPSLPLKVPMSIIRWLVYSIIFSLLVLPFVVGVWQVMCGGMILGFFAGLLNGIKNK
ncbi:MAG TPA: hypothetical protein VHL77_02120 [Ferruginibacter sp.]|jgi:hypothetical protein|nr:hypothetical protein [Ferruginibacter sp.]